MLVSAMFVAKPPFRVPDCYVRDWLFIKWISVDAVEVISRSGTTLHRIGIFDPGGGGGGGSSVLRGLITSK